MSKQRRTFSPQFKVDAVLDLLTGTKAPSEICRERDITDKLLYRWKNEFLERVPGVFEGKRGRGQDHELVQRVAELERMVGRLTLENEILKNAVSWRVERRAKNGR